MPRRMPVLRQHDVLEILGQRVDQRHDLVAARHRQRAARTEIILHVDDDQRLFHAALRFAIKLTEKMALRQLPIAARRRDATVRVARFENPPALNSPLGQSLAP